MGMYSMESKDVKKLLKDLGWSSTRLAVELDVSEDTVRRWLRRSHLPTGPSAILLRQLRHNFDADGVKGISQTA